MSNLDRLLKFIIAVATLLLIIDLFDFFTNRIVRYLCYLALGISATALFYLHKNYDSNKEEDEG
ncbi:hypothetical protein HX017_02630 [Myroides marinus]|uniref:hypothetical protein n=1 Tax=Myroides TaxID=76831 RepID=UPI000AB24EC3|nr:hypothetical protein [Myroides marinus]MDR0196411.1 hypothetical protein [Myroides sp.]MDM1346244.1 hypothetical protein [Myroides marinus]MDM1349496.1 hypothetical protein [Myroides marinus]MDM1353843.1 hypothetical protein [Myroides marinus]MDM1356706.1 hypothetical protein [Myroides marinus]